MSVLVIGQEKGEDLETRIDRNFGMMRPEGYRKTIRLMNLANKFNIPIISFIDTPGAYPGVGAEERGQAEAIAKSIECCMELKVPTIAIIIGEGGSGGAIALASSNKVLMLENAIYSVISPEGCATILWRDPKKMLDAAKAMKLSAKDLLKLKVIDEIIEEPLGGAHRDRDIILNNVRETLTKNLKYFDELSFEDMMGLGMYDKDELEDFEAFDQDVDWHDEVQITEVLSIQGRMKRRFAARRNRQKLKVARMRAARRAADPTRLKRRATRGARNMLKNRIARGRDLSTLPPAEKARIEGMVMRFSGLVSRIAQRMIPIVRKNEMKRLKSGSRQKSQKAKKYNPKKALASASKQKGKKFKASKKTFAKPKLAKKPKAAKKTK